MLSVDPPVPNLLLVDKFLIEYSKNDSSEFNSFYNKMYHNVTSI